MPGGASVRIPGQVVGCPRGLPARAVVAVELVVTVGPARCVAMVIIWTDREIA
ncbi:hypothetical protein [Streptomyces sp. NPDC006552]|uniref:hypothetical protein n=1 Tax=Streptomyces sp. NPDC006552 TaxID=3157179 RepID=UPI0033B1EBC7